MIKRIRGFQEGTTLAERDRMRISTALVFIVISGCTGDLVELGTGGPKGDMAMATGGQDQGMDSGTVPTTAKFFPDIQMDIDTKGCTNAACHNNATNPPALKAMATAQADIDANYMNFMSDCNPTAPEQSLVLAPMLPGGGHLGGQQFASTADPIYMKWLAWIQAGAPKQ
jgi:predicted CxxxxCH...CXXCH cytochrome family protein